MNFPNGTKNVREQKIFRVSGTKNVHKQKNGTKKICEQNFFPNGTKNVCEQKMFQMEQKFLQKNFFKKEQKMFVVEQKKVTE